MRLFRKYILIILTLFLVVFLLQRLKVIPGLNDIFAPKEVLIENTPLLIKEIKEMAQMITITAYDEVVADSIKGSAYDVVKALTGIYSAQFSPAMDRLVIIAKGRVMAGTDLLAIEETDIFTEDDSVSLRLPRARILEVVINPSDISTFTETGAWSNDAVTMVKIEARTKMEQRALDKNILSLAENRSKLLMENFLKTAGFEKINVYY